MSEHIEDEVSGNADLLALMANRDEALHPDLLGWVETDGAWGPMLRHPLVYQIPLSMPGMANKCYEHKRAALAEAVRDEEWSTVVFLHERAYRLRALVDYCIGRRDDDSPLCLSSAPEYWELAADVWVDSENIGQVMSEWEAVLCNGKNLWLGTDEERAEFDLLPDPIRAWRGEIDDGGWSWTTDHEIAEWFANRFRKESDPPAMITGELIPKSHVFGYLTRRGESELLVRRDQ